MKQETQTCIINTPPFYFKRQMDVFYPSLSAPGVGDGVWGLENGAHLPLIFICYSVFPSLFLDSSKIKFSKKFSLT